MCDMLQLIGEIAKTPAAAYLKHLPQFNLPTTIFDWLSPKTIKSRQEILMEATSNREAQGTAAKN